MKILLLTPSVRPLGARRSLVELVTHLPDGVEPLVVCPSKEGIYLELKELGIGVEAVPHGAWRKVSGRIKSLFLQLPALGGIVGKFRPDLIHANEFHIVPQAHFGAPKIPLTSHVRLSITPRQIKSYSLNKCSQIITVSNAVKALFAASNLLERVKVIYNGVDVSQISPTSASGPGPEAPAGVLRFGIFGLISDRKNQLVAAEAIARANKRGARVRLLIAGDAFGSSVEYGERLHVRINADDLLGHVEWIPFQKDIASLYRSIDINLLISSEEGFGRTIIEAGAAKVPSIGSRVGGIPELIVENKTGWLVNSGDAEELAETMVRLYNMPGSVNGAGAAALGHVQQHFTIEAHVREMVATWQECIDLSRITRV